MYCVSHSDILIFSTIFFLTHNFYAFFMFWLDLSINIHEYLFSYPLDRKSVKEHGLMSGLFRDIHSHRRNAISNTKNTKRYTQTQTQTQTQKIQQQKDMEAKT